MSEGFFADVTVLVEGEDDRAAILGVASALGHQLESDGIAVIPCGGKTCLDRPAAIFRQFGIPVYVIWDGDEGDNDAKPEDNPRLLRLMGQPAVDWPRVVDDDFACFPRNLESTLGEELGQNEFNAWLAECKTEYCIPKTKHAIKNPAVIEGIIQRALQGGNKSATLESIVGRILALRA